MLLELHIIQNFAPSNLNRDDTGAPKDCEFGGYRRARISSQAIKRAVRREFADRDLIPAEQRAQRTKRVVDEVATRLAAQGRDREQAEAAVVAALGSVKITAARKDADDEYKTQYLLYLGEAEIAALTDLCHQHFNALTGQSAPAEAAAGRRGAKAASAGAVPLEVKKGVETLLNGGKAADLALFGRMLADLPERNVDAASQVAHALSTHAVSVEFDYYTAVDDLKPEDTAGADMIGTVEFNSACFYRYANLNLEQLTKNLGNDRELAQSAAAAYLTGMVHAIPTGKQNSFAAQSKPSLVMIVVREHGLWSLANAFVTPVRPRDQQDLVQGSIAALDRYWGKLDGMYGREEGGIRAVRVATMEPEALERLAGDQVAGVRAAIEQAVSAAFAGDGTGGGA